MFGRLLKLQDTAARGLAGTKKITMSAYDRDVAALPGLLYFIDPERMDQGGGGGYSLKSRDRRNGISIFGQRSAQNIVNGGADWNDRSVISFSDGNANASDLRLEKPVPDETVVPRSFTFIVALSVSSALASGNLTAHIMSAYNGGDYSPRWFFRSVSGTRRLTLFTDVGANGSNIVNDAGQLPPANVPAVYCCTYDNATRRCKMYINGGETPLTSSILDTPMETANTTGY